MNRVDPKTKTLVTTTFFILAGILGSLFRINNIHDSLPLLIFYIVLTLNTYYSLKLFTEIVGKHTLLQDIVDGLLVIAYVSLAYTFNSPKLFIYIVIILFYIACLKYVLLIGRLNEPRLIRKKIIIDCSGLLMGVVALILLYSNSYFIASWFLATIFTLANIFLLFVWPMYKLDR